MSALIVEPNQAKAKAISLYEKVEASAKKTLQYAVELGQFLIETKQAMGHGAFGQWLSELPFSDRTARRYMDIARNPEAIQGATNISQAYISLSGKTDTMANLNPEKQDEVLQSLVQLTERAWHLQFSKNRAAQIFWSAEKYDFTRLLMDTWEQLDNTNPYLKKHILSQIMPMKKEVLDNLPLTKYPWLESMCYCLTGIEMELEEITWEKVKEETEKYLMQTDAPEEEWQKFNSMCTEIAFDRLTFGELAHTHIVNIRKEALYQDGKNLINVFESFYFKITGQKATLKEIRKQVERS